MVTLDSNKIEAPFSALANFNADKDGVIHNIQEAKGEVITDKHIISGISSGLNYFEVNNRKQTIIIGTSAKILCDDYLKGININTIEQVVSAVNKQGEGFLKLDANRFIEEGRFLSIDTTNNLEIGCEPDKYLDALHTYKVNSRYKVDYRNQKDNKGIVFAGTQTSFKERIIFYDKYVELTNKPESRDFLKNVSNVPKLLNACKTILRVEQNSVQLRKIRERLNISGTGVLSVLQSTVKPNYNLALKIVKGAEQLSLFDELDSFETFHDFERYNGQESIIKKCNFDIELVEQVMRHFYSDKTNISRQRKEYRNLIFSIVEKERIEKTNEPDLVDKVLELLKAS